MKVQVLNDSLVVTPDKQASGMPIQALLMDRLSLPPRFIKQLFANHHVYLGNQAATESDLIRANQHLRLDGINDGLGLSETVNWESELPEVLYEDEHVLVVNKPAGILVYPGDARDHDTLMDRLLKYYALNGLSRKVRHVHRLDRQTSGALLYAKHAYSARAMDTLLAKRRISRTYIALVHGVLQPRAGTITSAIGRDRHVSGRYRISERGKQAITHYETIGIAEDSSTQRISLLKCKLETGRTHQIRVHLASLGHPIVGDKLYADGPASKGQWAWRDEHALHARMLSFVHPYLNQEIEVMAPIPDLFQQTMAKLGLTEAGK